MVSGKIISRRHTIIDKLTTIALFLLFLCVPWPCFSSVIQIHGTNSGSTMGYTLQLYNSLNTYRTKHTVVSLKLNRTLSETAEYLASRVLTAPTSFDIDDQEGVDYFISQGTTKPSASLVIETWYNESALYDFNNPGYNPVYLNFTQLIWKSATSIGFGSATSKNYTCIVAKFYPAGNIRGKFRQNVIPKYKKL